MSTTINSAALEVWGATIKSYCSAAGVVLLYYDWLLTLDDEIRLVWSGALSWPTALYLIDRYLTISVMTYSTRQIANFRPALSTRSSVLFVTFTSVLCGYRILSCQIWIGVTLAAFIVRMLTGTALLCLRLVALYRDVLWMKWLLWVAFALGYGARSGMAIAGAYFFMETVIYSPLSEQCVTAGLKRLKNPLPGGLVALFAPMALDLLILGLTFIKAFKNNRLLGSHSSSAIMRAMMHEEILWFLVIVAVRTSELVSYFVFPPALLTVISNIEGSLESVLICRFFLNLRSIYHHGECRLGSQSAASMVSPVRTHPFWKRANQDTTGFSVSHGVETSLYGNLVKERHIPHAATVELELGIVSQSRYDGDEHGIKPPADLTPPDDR